MPKFLGEIVQSGGDFALLDSSNIRGGFTQVNTDAERDAIISDKKKEGMIVLVVSTGKLYEWKNGRWTPFLVKQYTTATECEFLTINQKITEVLPTITSDSGATYAPIIVKDSSVFKAGDILGWNLESNDNGTINGEYTVIAYIMDDVIYTYTGYNDLPPADTEISLVGSTSDIVRRSVLVKHLYHGAIVLTQFLNISVDNINTNYTFRLGQSEVNYWKLYAEDVYLKGTFIDDRNRNLSDLVTLNQETINTGLSSIRREFEYDNLLNNPYFISGLNCWVTKNVATYFKITNNFILTNRTLLSTKKGGAYVIVEDGANVLRLIDGYVLQKNENLKKVLDTTIDIGDEPSWYTVIFSYDLVTDGTLELSIENIVNGDENSRTLNTIQLHKADGYKIFKTTFKWDGNGDIKLNFSGEIKIKSMAMRINELKNLEDKLIKYHNEN